MKQGLKPKLTEIMIFPDFFAVFNSEFDFLVKFIISKTYEYLDSTAISQNLRHNSYQLTK